MADEILILSHGSRDPEGNKEFLSLCALASKRLEVEIRPAFLEYADPLIPEAIRRAVEKGAKRVSAIPYFLFASGHVKKDIPEIFSQAKKEHPHVDFRVSPPLAIHEDLFLLSLLRLKESVNGARPEQLLIVGRGSLDSEANSLMEKIVLEIEGRSGISSSCCFIDLAKPLYAEALPEALSEGPKNLIILPFFLFTGILVKRIQKIAQEEALRYPKTEILVAPHLGAHELMADIVVDRIREIQ